MGSRYLWRYTTYDASDPDVVEGADWVVFTDRERGLWESSVLPQSSRDYSFGGWDGCAHHLTVRRRLFPCACSVCRCCGPPHFGNVPADAVPGNDGNRAACPFADEFGPWRLSKIQYVLANGEDSDEDERPLRGRRRRKPHAKTLRARNAALATKQRLLGELAYRLRFGSVMTLLVGGYHFEQTGHTAAIISLSAIRRHIAHFLEPAIVGKARASL